MLVFFCLAVFSVVASQYGSVQAALTESRNWPTKFREFRRDKRNVTDDDGEVTCSMNAYPKLHYYGTLLSTLQDVQNIDDCVALCYNYKIAVCKSVNFDKSGSCQLLLEVLDVSSARMVFFYGEAKQNTTYAVLLSCKKATKTMDASGIPAGSCGVGIVEPQILRKLRPGKNQQRIVGGDDALPHSYPWMVNMRNGFSDKRPLCGGSLLRIGDIEESDIVLTASHCYIEDEDPDTWELALGAHLKFRFPDAKNEERIPAMEFIKHESYNKTNWHNDIGIIVLARPVKFNDYIQPVCLPKTTDVIAEGTNGVVTGWGNTQRIANETDSRQSVDGNMAGTKAAAKAPAKESRTVLKEVLVPYISGKKCAEMYKSVNDAHSEFLNDTVHICAGYANTPKDSCQGDSGGPLVFKLNKRFVQFGIVSYGSGCAAQNRPGVYTKVVNYLNWIDEKIKTKSAVYKSLKS